MNSYQVTIALKNDLDEKKRKELLDSVTKSFDKLEKEDVWGTRGLAYAIDHQEKAYFINYQFQSEPNKITDIDKQLKLNEDVLRYLLTKKEEKAKKVVKSKKVSEEVVEKEVKEKKVSKKTDK